MTDVVAPTDVRPPMVAALSPSSISTWKQCPRRFFYEKILRLPTEPGLEAVCGSFVHEVLQRLMDLTPPQRTPDEARRIAHEQWPVFVADEDNQFAELGLDDAEVSDFKRRAWTGIAGYFNIEDPTRVEVVATEQEVQAELDGAPLFGIVDRLERWGDQLVVSDYKTGKAPKWRDEVDEKLEQLRLYAAILDALGTPVSVVRLLFVSPQLGAAAKAARCAGAVEAAMAALAEVLADPTPAVERIEQAYRDAREAAAATEDRNAHARAVAVDVAWTVAKELSAQPERLAQLLLDAVAARRKAFFSQRDAEAARPREITLDVLPEHISAARAEVAEVWRDARSAYESWDFPAHTGVLCDWCPFAQMCDGYAGWVAAGRPAAA